MGISTPRIHRGLSLELTPNPISIELVEIRIHRLISENPVIIFSRRCMSHVMRQLLSVVGVYPAVIKLENEEIAAIGARTTAPELYIGDAWVGELEKLMALHVSNSLVPKHVQVGALRNEFSIS